MSICLRLMGATTLALAAVLIASVAYAQVVHVDPDTGAFASDPTVSDPEQFQQTAPPPALQTLDAATREVVEFESPVAGGGVGVWVAGGFLHLMKTGPQTEGQTTVGCEPIKKPGSTAGVCIATGTRSHED